MQQTFDPLCASHVARVPKQAPHQNTVVRLRVPKLVLTLEGQLYRYAQRLRIENPPPSAACLPARLAHLGPSGRLSQATKKTTPAARKLARTHASCGDAGMQDAGLPRYICHGMQLAYFDTIASRLSALTQAALNRVAKYARAARARAFTLITDSEPMSEQMPR